MCMLYCLDFSWVPLTHAAIDCINRTSFRPRKPQSWLGLAIVNCLKPRNPILSHLSSLISWSRLSCYKLSLHSKYCHTLSLDLANHRTQLAADILVARKTLSRTERSLATITQVSSLQENWKGTKKRQEGTAQERNPQLRLGSTSGRKSPAAIDEHLTPAERRTRQRYRRRISLTYHTYIHLIVCPWTCTYRPDPIHYFLTELWEIERIIDAIIEQNQQVIGRYHV